VRYTDEHGKEKVEAERMKLPPDTGQTGWMLMLLKNIPASATPPAMSMWW